MPLIYENLGRVKAKWSKYGFMAQPNIIQDAPVSRSYTCLPISDSDIISKQEPSYGTLVSPSDTSDVISLLS
jgi:hypothetical protein